MKSNSIDLKARILGVIVFLPLLVSCADYIWKAKGDGGTIEWGLNRAIGKDFSNLNAGDSYHLINETVTQQEYEYKSTSGCSWVVMVNKNSNIVESWQFTSPRNLCNRM